MNFAMTFRNGLIAGTVVGLIGPTVLKVASRHLIKSGLKGYQIVRHAAEELYEDIEDIKAEVEAEIEGADVPSDAKASASKAKK